MRLLLNEKILNIASVPGGIVAAVLSEVTDDGKMVVEYRLVSVDSNEVQRVSSNVYLLAKFGAGHKAAQMQVKNHLTCISCILKSEMLIIEDDTSAKLINEDGIASWVGIIKYKDEPACDAVFDGKNIWVSFQKNNALIRLDGESMREQLRIGGKSGDSRFSGPCGLFFENGELYVTNSGSNQIWKINTDTYSAEQYMEFNEPVYDYVKINSSEIVLLESGLYLV